VSDTTLEVIDCELVPLPSPLRLASPTFVASLREVEARIAALKVTDATTAQEAADLQGRLTKAGTMLESKRQELIAPVLDQQRKINALAKGPAERIEKAKQALKAQLTAYDNEQKAIAEKAERARQAELARLEKIRKQQEEEALAKAKEAARIAAENAARAPKAALELDDGDDEPPPAEPAPKTEVEKQIEVVRHAPAVVAPKVQGLAWKVTLVPVVVDVNKVPDLFLVKTPNMQAIRSTFCTGWKENSALPECAGVQFEIKKEPITR
jgi:hypothetical protein